MNAMGNAVFRGLVAVALKPLDRFSQTFGTIDYVRDLTHHASPEISMVKGGVAAHA